MIILSDLYTNMSPIDAALLAACCNGMAQYYLAQKDLESVGDITSVSGGGIHRHWF